MATAVITFVYNEKVNLPIWRRYYGGIFGEKSLFVIDHGSSDGSTADLGAINKLSFPRVAMDDTNRAVFVESFVRGLLEYFDTVIYTDCDEMIVPNLSKYYNLAEYIEKNDFQYTAPVGLNLQHIISIESALNLALPILSQRKFARFTSGMCKPLVTRIPIAWTPGFHVSNQPVQIDPDLFLLHLKFMDHNLALAKQKQTREMTWSERSIAASHGVHHRYDDERFIREGFLDPNNIATHPDYGVQPFEFSEEIERLKAEVVFAGGFYHTPQFPGKIVELPQYMRTAL